jgi:hypothetical protein
MTGLNRRIEKLASGKNVEELQENFKKLLGNS